MRTTKLKLLVLSAIVALSFVFPFAVGDPIPVTFMVNILLVCGAATAWNIFSGSTGYLSLGHAAYYGLGAYTLAIVCKVWGLQGDFLPFGLLPLAGLVSLLFAIPLGWIALKTRRHTFMILTLAILSIFRALASNFDSITGGSEGMFLPFPTWDAPFFNIPFYFAALAVFLLVLTMAWLLHRSKFGLGLRALHDDEGRASGLGINTEHYTLVAYVLSAFFVAMVGGLAAYYAGSVTPDQSLSPTFDLEIVLIVFLGGRGNIVGPLVGGIVVIPLQQFLNQQFGANPLESVLYGSFLLAVILLLPEGIVPSLGKHWELWMRSHHKRACMQAQRAQKHAAPEMVPGTIGSLTTQNVTAQSVPVEPPSLQTVWSRPHYPPTLPVSPLSTPPNSLMRVRAQRLVSASARNPAAKEQAEVRAPTHVSWRCPYCHKPFLLRGNTCFCPKCGSIRTIPGN